MPLIESQKDPFLENRHILTLIVKPKKVIFFLVSLVARVQQLPPPPRILVTGYRTMYLCNMYLTM